MHSLLATRQVKLPFFAMPNSLLINLMAPSHRRCGADVNATDKEVSAI